MNAIYRVEFVKKLNEINSVKHQESSLNVYELHQNYTQLVVNVCVNPTNCASSFAWFAFDIKSKENTIQAIIIILDILTMFDKGDKVFTMIA